MLIIVTVDGVLTRRDRPQRRLRPWTRATITVDGESRRLMLNPQHGAQLLALAEDAGAQLVLATPQADYATREIAPRVGLPALPVLPMEGRQGCPPGVTWRTPHVAAYAGQRPFVWFDGAVAYADATYLAGRCGPFRLVYVDRWDGLTDLDFADATRWFASLAGGAR